MKWVLRHPAPSQEVESLAKLLSTDKPFPNPIANILIQREIDSFEKAKSFFLPKENDLHDPFVMKDMDKAVNRLVQAFQTGEKIWIYGDYDVDGTTAVTVFCLFLKTWGFSYEYYIPDRYDEGYGISYKGISEGHKQGATLMVSLDCGIKAVEKVRFANQQGMDVIICDHHRPGEILPEAHAILDPKQADCPYPFKELTGCGIGLKLSIALNQTLIEMGAKGAPENFDPFEAFSDFAALSIASDIVPVVGENRTIAYFGVKKIRSSPNKGIQSIMNLSQHHRDWDISDLVFFIGPHINAAGRLGHARDAVEILLANKDVKADSLSTTNEARKDLEHAITAQALEMIGQDKAYAGKNTTVLYHPDWHKGVIGIVASRLTETYYRPTVLLARSENGKLTGSGRSVSGFNLYEAMEKCTDHMVQFGGHKYAAGLTMEEESFADFAHAFDVAVTEKIKPEHKIPILNIDGELAFNQIEDRFIRILNRLGPFGPQNMTPVFIATNVEVLDAVVLKEVHLKLSLRQSGYVFSAIGFNLAEKWKKIDHLLLDIVFQPSFNTWKNKTTINLKLKDIRHSQNEITSA